MAVNCNFGINGNCGVGFIVKMLMGLKYHCVISMSGGVVSDGAKRNLVNYAWALPCGQGFTLIPRRP